ncbi:MAG: N-acetylmuramoyl-L-alanine amidase [Bacteroidales bacterium]|nr:N-acetylmuramoyl-L-alanine amidase [Bacteroidales bacterium]
MKVSFKSFLLIVIGLTFSLTLFAEGKIKIKTVVVDAGHGGVDPGCIYGKDYREKVMTLDIALEVGALIEKNYPDVRVIYTRKKDVAIGLYERSKVAFDNNADLFISIHVDAVDMKLYKNSPTGHTVYILSTEVPEGKSDMYRMMQEVCKRENSVMTLEDNYEIKYKDINVESPNAKNILGANQAYVNMLQSLELASCVNSALANGPIKYSKGVRPGRIQVLWNCGAPGILVETGYITHATDREILSDHDRRMEIAKCVFEGFEAYKKEYEKSMSGLGVPAETSTGSQSPATSPAALIAQSEASSSASKPSNASSTTTTSASKPSTTATTATSTSDNFYGTQIFVLSKRLGKGDPAFKGFEVKVVERNGRYEYFAGCSSSLETARKKYAEIVKKFPESYIVKMENGKKTTVK